VAWRPGCAIRSSSAFSHRAFAPDPSLVQIGTRAAKLCGATIAALPLVNVGEFNA
jgi:hypothetical protein